MRAPVPPEPAHPPRVVILGGGITGLAAAWELEPLSRAGRISVDLFEASPRVGGPIVSDHGSGHVLEGGPDCFLTTKPGAVELCEELGIGGSLIGVRPSARRAYIYREGKLHPIPAVLGPGRWGSARSLLSSSLLSRVGRLRMLLGGAFLGIRPIRVDERSALGPQLRYRFGAEATDWLLEPFVAGVHPAPLETLSASAVANVLPPRWVAGRPRPPGGSSARSSAPAPSRSRVRATPGVFASLRDGMEELPRSLARRLEGAKVHLAQPALEVRRQGGGYAVVLADGRSTAADGVVLAVPPPVAARLVERQFPEAASHLRSVRMETLVVVGAVFDRTELPLPLDGSGVLVPRPAGLPISAITWLSAKWDRDEPDPGRVAVRVFLRCEPGRPELPTPEESLALARRGLEAVMGITAAPRYTTIVPHRSALAWYEVGHLGRIREVRRLLGDGSGLELAGSAYDGIGIPDAIESGRNAARRIGIRCLGTSGTPRREEARQSFGEPVRPESGPSVGVRSPG